MKLVVKNLQWLWMKIETIELKALEWKIQRSDIERNHWENMVESSGWITYKKTIVTYKKKSL